MLLQVHTRETSSLTFANKYLWGVLRFRSENLLLEKIFESIYFESFAILDSYDI